MRFVLLRFLWIHPPAAAFVFAPPFSKEYRVVSPSLSRRDAHPRVLWHVRSDFSVLITFDTGYEFLLIKYMLKEYSRFRVSHLLSNTFSFLFFDSSSSPPLHLSGL